jgi:IS5 family transposase
MMVSLHFLKRQQDRSDEEVVTKWVKNSFRHSFSVIRFSSHQASIDSSSMTGWRTRLGQSGSRSLNATIRAGLKLQAILSSDLSRMNVATTLRPKAIRYPTHDHLYVRMRQRLVKATRNERLRIHQSDASFGKRLVMNQNRHTLQSAAAMRFGMLLKCVGQFRLFFRPTENDFFGRCSPRSRLPGTFQN